MSNERIYEYDLVWKGNADSNNAVTTGYVYSYSNTNNRIVFANIQNTSNVEFDPERFELNNTVYSLDSDTQFKFSNFDDLFVYLRKTDVCPDCGPGSVITQYVPDQYITVVIPPETYRINRVCSSCGCVGDACNCDSTDVTVEEQTANIKVSDAYTITATVEVQSCDPPYLKVQNSSGKFLPEYPIVCNGKELGVVGSLTEIEKNPYIKNYIIERPGEFYSDYTNPCTVSNEPYINRGLYLGPHIAQNEYFTGKRTQDYNDDYIIVSNWDITGNNVPIGHVLDLYDNANKTYTTLSMNVSAVNVEFSENITYANSNTLVFQGATITANNPTNIIGSSTMTLLEGEDLDDTFIGIDLPFEVRYENTNYSTVYLVTNGYLTFVPYIDSTIYNADINDPPVPKIIIKAEDLLQFSVYTKTYGSAPNRIFVIRWEGTTWAARNTPTVTLSYEISFFETYNGKSPSGFYVVSYDDYDIGVLGENILLGAYGASTRYDDVLISGFSMPKSYGIQMIENFETINVPSYQYTSTINNNSKLLEVKSSNDSEYSVYLFGNVAVKSNTTNNEVISIKNNCDNILVSTSNTTTIGVAADFNKSLFTKGYSESIEVIRTSNSNVFINLTNSYVFHVKSDNKMINNMSFINNTNNSTEVRSTLIVFSDINRINNNVWNRLNVQWSNSRIYINQNYYEANTRPEINSSNTAILSLLKNPVEDSWFGFWHLYEIQT